MMGRVGEILRAPRLLFWLSAIVVFVVIQSTVRLAILIWSAAEGMAVGWLGIPVFLHGVVDDIATALVLSAPVALVLLLVGNWWQRRFLAVIGHLALLFFLWILITSAVGELIFWNEFTSRYNDIAVNYLIFPREVIGNIHQSFDLIILMPLALIATGIFYLLLRARLSAALATPATGERLPASLIVLVAAGIGLLVWSATNQQWPQQRTLAEAADNGLHRLVRAATTKDQEYIGLYPSIDPARAIEVLRKEVAQPNTTFIDDRNPISRRVKATGPANKLNIVLVIQESFGSIYVDSLDNPLDEKITPHFDALAKDGLFYTNIYATGNRTVRGLEAMLTGFTPIPGVSTSRRPGSEGMSSLPATLSEIGYKTAFLYGGLGVFDNMNTFWNGIGFDQVWDERDIEDDSYTTIWGVADEYLFTESLKRMDALTADGEPAFLGLLTVSNHRPYSYPADRIDKSPDAKRRENAATYADWAFGDFIKRARGHKWFKDTIFIFVGDHGPRISGQAVVPVPSYRIPMMFYAPAHIKPARVDTLGSNLDLAPTLLGLLGVDYTSPFFGRDLRLVQPGDGRAIMAHNFSIAYAAAGKVAAIVPGADPRGYKMRPGPKELIPLEDTDPDVLERVIAITQSAHRMFYEKRYHRKGWD
jgi:phosphoglycerol transferase MdoB-like AlkP superfamily enzyme